jgi:hypothetical protein
MKNIHTLLIPLKIHLNNLTNIRGKINGKYHCNR